MSLYHGNECILVVVVVVAWKTSNQHCSHSCSLTEKPNPVLSQLLLNTRPLPCVFTSLEQRNEELQVEVVRLKTNLAQQRHWYQVVQAKIVESERARNAAELRNATLQKEMEQFFDTFGELNNEAKKTECIVKSFWERKCMNWVWWYECVRSEGQGAEDWLVYKMQLGSCRRIFPFLIVKSLKGNSTYFTHKCVLTGLGEDYCYCIWEKSGTKRFLAPEEVAYYLINCLQWCHSVAKLHCG